MLIGVPKEIKVHEYRVGLTPNSVREFTVHGHQVLVETHAGVGIGSSDDDYRAAGARIAATPADIFAQADLVVKVKEPQAVERLMRLSIQAGAAALERTRGGRGILLDGVPGVAPAKVVVIGGGVVGENAIYMALGMAADVTVLDRNVGVLARLARRFGAALKTVYSPTRATLEE